MRLPKDFDAARLRDEGNRHDATTPVEAAA
jgi:hypothetical protein